MRRIVSAALVFILLFGCIAAPAAAAAHPFSDVPVGSWYEEYTSYCYSNGLIKGVTNTTFGPNANMTRGMLVTVLHRMEGEPKTTGAFPFADVPVAAYYRDAVHWAYHNKIVNGTSATIFAPEKDITREQMVTIFYRYAQVKGQETVSRADLSGYRDDADISDYAVDAFQWAVALEIINGIGNNRLAPQGLATRAHCAAMLTRLHKLLNQTPDEPPIPEPPTPEPPTPEPPTPEPETAAETLPDETKAQLQTNLQNRINEILSTDTTITHSDTFIPGQTYTGTAYYISNDGDDANDGLTPDTAWCTVSKLLQELDQRDGSVLQPGDAVFLRRGDIFRLPEWSLDISASGITLSAYGEGEKPILTASSENGTGAEKWNLVYTDATGKKIWQYYRDMRDISRIVLNDGEAITTRVYEFYDGSNYISCEDTDWWMHSDQGVTLKDTSLPLQDSMTEDLTSISRPAATGDDTNIGPLYLRCDSGNPGEIYTSIEFSEFLITGLIWLKASDVVIDNISFRCGGNSYIKNGLDSKELENFVIQNCEFAYGGGCVTFYTTSESGNHFVIPQGDGIYGLVRNTLIQNNYFHDSLSTDVTYEHDLADTATPLSGYYHYWNNVSVNTMGVRLDSTAPVLQHLDSVQICGNQIWNVGHWDNGKYAYAEGALVLMPSHYKAYLIKDNVFFATENGHATNALLNLYLYDFEEAGYARPQLVNNTYVQHSGRNFGDFSMQHNEAWSIDDPALLTKATELLQDTTGTFYVIP